jgi:hypothetical protein
MRCTGVREEKKPLQRTDLNLLPHEDGDEHGNKIRKKRKSLKKNLLPHVYAEPLAKPPLKMKVLSLMRRKRCTKNLKVTTSVLVAEHLG